MGPTFHNAILQGPVCLPVPSYRTRFGGCLLAGFQNPFDLDNPFGKAIDDDFDLRNPIAEVIESICQSHYVCAQPSEAAQNQGNQHAGERGEDDFHAFNIAGSTQVFTAFSIYFDIFSLFFRL